MEQERRNRGRETLEERRRRRRGQRRRRRLVIRCVIGVLAALAGFLAGWFARGTTIRRVIDLSAVKAPEWIDQQFLTVNQYSRPGTKLAGVNGIVIHYVANAETTAKNNRDYFESLKSQSGANVKTVSSHFVIGLEGEIIQCIPIDEKAFASNNRNSDTIAIECCHPDESGKFTEETYGSLVKLTAWLCGELDLEAGDVIRHYDVTKKSCPKYFVDHEDAWKKFRKDVKRALREQ